MPPLRSSHSRSLGLRLVTALSTRHLGTRRIILQKARDHAGSKRTLALSLHGRGRFQVLFHSPRRGAFHRSLTVLCAIGHDQYLALDRGRPGFPQDFSCPVVLEMGVPRNTLAGTGLSPALVGRSRPFPSIGSRRCSGCTPNHTSHNPPTARRARLARSRFRQPSGSLATTADGIRLPAGTEMFQFPGCPLP